MQGEIVKPPPRYSTALRIVGGSLTLVALAYVIERGSRQWIELRDALSDIAVSDLLISMILYFVASLLLALTWPFLLRATGHAGTPLLPLAARHLQAQLAKYLPGGIFHFAQRHAGSRRWGLGHRDLVFAASLESLMLLSISALLALGVSSDPRLAALFPWLPHLIWLSPLAIPAAWLVTRWWAKRNRDPKAIRPSSLPLVLVALIDAAFFVICSASLFMLADVPLAAASYWIGWLSLAWISGYVVPGAPGGIGVREAVLVLGLSPLLGEAQALAIALAYRLVTLVSDAACTVTGYVAEQLGRSSE